MSWKSLQSKAFIYSMDALISLIIVIGFSNALTLFLDQEENLNDFLLYQQAQDILEVCSKKFDFSENCFNFLKEVNPSIQYCFNNCTEKGISLKRRYAGKEIELRVWV